MSEVPLGEIKSQWRSWIEANLGGTPAQIERAEAAVMAAIAAKGTQQQVAAAASAAWQGEPVPRPGVGYGKPQAQAAPPWQAAPPRPGAGSRAQAPASPGRIRGWVAGFQPRQEMRLRRYITVWSFHIERGDGLPAVAVEMRAYSFTGAITNGDEVEMAGHASGRILRPRSLRNLTSNSTVRVRRKPTPVLTVIARFAAVILLLIAAIYFAVPESSLPPVLPGKTLDSSAHATQFGGPALVAGLALLVLAWLIKRFAR